MEYDGLYTPVFWSQMKVYKKKRRSCPMCKPNKMGIEPCWTAKDLDRLKRMEKEAREIKRTD